MPKKYEKRRGSRFDAAARRVQQERAGKLIFLIHGANLNMLGSRDPSHYGSATLNDIEKRITERAAKKEFRIEAYQSNSEGAIIDFLQHRSPEAKGIIANLGAFTHYSRAISEALKDTRLPVIEVHLSDVQKRALEDSEPWRAVSVLESLREEVIAGHGEKGYDTALDHLIQIILGERPTRVKRQLLTRPVAVRQSTMVRHPRTRR